MGLIQNKVTVSQPNSHVVVKNAGGLRGLTGETGPQGPQGVPGEAATVTAGTTTTLPAGSDATVQNVGSTSAAIFNFGIPKGDKGDTGETGAAATISVGSTSTLPAGSSATVTNSGTSSAAVFDFGIPKGDKGDTGATGADGYSPSATVTKTGDTATITITDKDGTTTASISDGTTPTVNDGTLTIQKNGTTVQTFSADQASNVTANITVPTQFSELSGTVSSSQIEDEAITTGSVSGTGTNITLAGTMEGGAIESVELNGDTEQTTYSGKNLNVYPYTGGGNGRGITFTANSDGTVILNGQNDGQGNSVYFFFNNQSNPMTLPAGTYYIAPPSNTRVGFVMYDGTNYYGFSANNGYSVTFASSVSIRQFYVQVYHTDVTFSNLKIYPMLTTSAQHTEADFEPYVGGTASPNPDYPQNVNVVTGEQTIELHAKNLLDNSHPTTVSANTTWTPTANGGLYSATTGWTGGVQWRLKVEEGATYQFQYKERTNQNLYLYISTFTDATYTTVKTLIVNDGRYTKYPIVPDSPYLKITFNNSAAMTDVAIEELMFEKADERTTYEPYKGVTKTVNLGKNLCNPSDVESVFVYASFNRAAYGAGDTSVIIPVLPNTDYTISTLATQARYRGGFSDSIPVSGGGDITVYNGFNKDSQLVSVTTNSGDHKYLIVNATDLTKIQIEKGSTATTYAPYFTPIELCKIGTYQDYIYKSGEDWYLHQETGEFNLADYKDLTGWYVTSGGGHCVKHMWANNFPITDIKPQPNMDSLGYGMSNYFTEYNYAELYNGVEKVGFAFGQDGIYLSNNDWTLEDFRTWVTGKVVDMYYIKTTPTDTQITNATLISELEDLLSATTYSGTTYITVSGDLASPLEVVAEADSKLAPDSVYGAAIKDGAVSVDKIADLKALADALAPYLNS